MDEFAERAVLAGQQRRLVLIPRARVQQPAHGRRRERRDPVDDDRVAAAVERLVGRLLVVRRRRVAVIGARARIRRYVPAHYI